MCFSIIAEDAKFASKKGALDTRTPTGEFLLIMFGVMDELVCEYIFSMLEKSVYETIDR